MVWSSNWKYFSVVFLLALGVVTSPARASSWYCTNDDDGVFTIIGPFTVNVTDTASYDALERILKKGGLDIHDYHCTEAGQFDYEANVKQYKDISFSIRKISSPGGTASSSPSAVIARGRGTFTYCFKDANKILWITNVLNSYDDVSTRSNLNRRLYKAVVTDSKYSAVRGEIKGNCGGFYTLSRSQTELDRAKTINSYRQHGFQIIELKWAPFSTENMSVK